MLDRRALLALAPALAPAALGGCSVARPMMTGGGSPFSPASSEPEWDVPYVPTPPAMVAAMIEMAAVPADGLLIDLGSGDGRIPIAAARAGARAIGIEIDPALVARAGIGARAEGVQDRVRFRREDLFATPLREADAVTLYLLPAINQRLRPRLLTELRPGARVVSHAFDMGDWAADEHRVVDGRNAYRWTIPAVAGGSWRLSLPGRRDALLEVEQRYQTVSGTVDGVAFGQGTLTGDRLAITLPDGRRLAGIVGLHAIEPDPAVAGTTADWRAARSY